MLHVVLVQHGRPLGLVKQEEIAPLLKMRLWSAPGPDHALIKLLIKLQAVPCEGDVAGGSVLLAHPAHAHRRRGTGIGGVALDDDQAPRETVLAQVIGNAGPNDAPPDNDDVCCVCHASHTSLSIPYTVPLDTMRTGHEMLLYLSPPARGQAPSQNTRRQQMRYNMAQSTGPSARP